jgi:hypothetical protein
MCVTGIWGVSKVKDLGAGWASQFALLLIGGILALAKAFAFI